MIFIIFYNFDDISLRNDLAILVVHSLLHQGQVNQVQQKTDGFPGERSNSHWILYEDIFSFEKDRILDAV